MSKYACLAAFGIGAAAMVLASAAEARIAPNASPGFLVGGMFGHAYGSRYETGGDAGRIAHGKQLAAYSATTGKQHRVARGGGASRSCLKSSARALLNRIEARFGRVQVISACRPGATVRGSGKPSKHRYGLAIDFRAPSGKKPAIVNWLRANHTSGGTMTYRNKSHIHVDIGYRFVSLGARG